MLIEQARLAAAELSGGVSSSVIYSTALREARRVQPAAKRILDFGSGSGQLIVPLVRAFPGAVVDGADIMGKPTSLPEVIGWHCGDLNIEMPITGQSYDLIMAIEIIEHLENPRQVLREMYRLLKSNGIAIFTTPNLGSIKSVLTFALREHHALFDDSNYPAHITPVGKVDFLRAGAEAGFFDIEFFYTDRGTIPKLLYRHWQNIPLVGRRLNGQLFSDNVGVILRKP